MVKIRALGWIAEKLGFSEREIHLDKPVKIIDFLPLLNEISEEHLIILVNNEPADKNTIIKNEDKIVLMPVVSGG